MHANSNPKKPQEISGACFSHAVPTPLKNPKLVVASDDALALLDISNKQTARVDAADFFCGNKVMPGAETAAHCYCGHQFGNFAGQLGDGATMYLGEVVNRQGDRWEVQFKGAGLTNYSRTADGRKVLRSSLREFLASESMHALGLQTTRAGAIVTSDTRVERDLLYDGNVKHERASVVLRIARSFLRFGSFEICKPIDASTGRAGPSVGQHHLLQALLDHVSGLLQPQLVEEPSEVRWLATFEEVVSRTARLVASWQTVGFCHGVLNTDNMSVMGDTIDYGPFGFMEAYDPDHVCNMSDGSGRYAFKEQPKICKWNCEKLAEAIAPLLPFTRTKPVLDRFDEIYEVQYAFLMRRKLGLSSQQPSDPELFRRLFETMERTGADFTHTFRALARHAEAHADANALKPLRDEITTRCALPAQLAQARERRASSSQPIMPKAQLLQLLQMAERDPNILSMFGPNPASIKAELRDELAKAECGASMLTRAGELRKLSPEEKTANDAKQWGAWLQEYSARVQLEAAVQVATEACAAAQQTAAGDEERNIGHKGGRRQSMLSCNPRVVLHNWVAQEAIDAAEGGDYSSVQRILCVLTQPYAEGTDHYAQGPPDLAAASHCVS